MYQRYIANPDGTFRKTIVEEIPHFPPPCPPPECRPEPHRFSLRELLPESLDVGDLLLVLILLLLLLDSEEDDPRTILLILAACFFF